MPEIEMDVIKDTHGTRVRKCAVLVGQGCFE